MQKVEFATYRFGSMNRGGVCHGDIRHLEIVVFGCASLRHQISIVAPAFFGMCKNCSAVLWCFAGLPPQHTWAATSSAPRTTLRGMSGAPIGQFNIPATCLLLTQSQNPLLNPSLWRQAPTVRGRAQLSAGAQGSRVESGGKERLRADDHDTEVVEAFGEFKLK